jgi:sortase A
MLHIKQTRTPFSIKNAVLTAVIVLLLASGLYLLLLGLSPSLPFIYTSVIKPLDVSAVPKPKVGVNRIMIPKIGVNIHYGTDGKTSLDEGALWRHPERGNPVDGGNFIIAAHRFSIQPTPGGTVKASPFYHLDQLAPGDQIIIDYKGKRYGYEVVKSYDVKPNQIEIEAPSTTPKLTLYSCNLDGSASGRIVIDAKPVGEVQVS